VEQPEQDEALPQQHEEHDAVARVEPAYDDGDECEALSGMEAAAAAELQWAAWREDEAVAAAAALAASGDAARAREACSAGGTAAAAANSAAGGAGGGEGEALSLRTQLQAAQLEVLALKAQVRGLAQTEMNGWMNKTEWK
jgi:hypothetical protein